jgi:DNA topoisomerase I
MADAAGGLLSAGEPVPFSESGPAPSAVPGLNRSDPHGPGITRFRLDGGFGYRDPSGAEVTDAGTLRRIRGLALPPA